MNLSIIDKDILLTIYRNGYTNQRKLMEQSGYSIGSVNKSISSLTEEGFIDKSAQLTKKGSDFITDYSPKNAIILICVLSVISVFFGRKMLIWISDTASFACCVAYCMVAMSFLIIRKKEPNLARPYKVKNYKAVGLIATIMAGLMALLYLIPGSGCTFTSEELIIAVAWIVLGIIFSMISKMKYGDLFGRDNNNL